MALGTQRSPTQALVTFCLWARRNGYAVGEMHGFSAVHPVHTARSWHYDKDGAYGKAADINKNGTDERRHLVAAVDRAQELGLAVIYARDGTAGPAAGHRGHLHVDVGPFSHLGTRSFVPRGGGDVVTEALQRAVRVEADQLWGPVTDRHLEAVRCASRLKGEEFPFGVEFIRQILGVAQDGAWDEPARVAHDVTVAAIRRALRLPASPVWDVATEAAYVAARDLRRRVPAAAPGDDDRT